MTRAPRKMVENMSDHDVWRLKRGGHDYRKVYAAYKSAMEHTGQPTVILAQTIKGYGLGPHFAGRNATHQMKKLTPEDLHLLRDSLKIPISDEDLDRDPYQPPYYRPDDDDETLRYLRDRRSRLGGGVPSRRVGGTSLKLPEDSAYEVTRRGSGKQQVATTMAFVRLLRDLMRDKDFGPRVVPIIPDEARTFGMDSFFPTAKIYNPHGQKYLSVDADLMLAYKESTSGQILHVGINEGGSVAAFTAAGTSYATHGEPMVPIYTFYSMFGFQRTADSIWAASDQMARGFLIGATAGRTTLTGEGLQHSDGHSPLYAATNPAVVAYDPAYAYEIGHIVKDGLRRMYGESPENVIYYLTVYNEPNVQPPQPEDLDVEGVLRGMYLLSRGRDEGPRVQLLASRRRCAVGAGGPGAAGAGLRGRGGRLERHVVERAAARRPGLRRAGVPAPAGRAAHAVRHPAAVRAPGPVVAVSDYMRQVPDQIRQWVPGRLRHARRGRVRRVRHPARRPGGTSTSTGRRSPSGRCRCWLVAARWTRRPRAERPSSTGCSTSPPGTSGNSGGEA